MNWACWQTRCSLGSEMMGSFPRIFKSQNSLGSQRKWPANIILNTCSSCCCFVVGNRCTCSLINGNQRNKEAFEQRLSFQRVLLYSLCLRLPPVSPWCVCAEDEGRMQSRGLLRRGTLSTPGAHSLLGQGAQGKLRDVCPCSA